MTQETVREVLEGYKDTFIEHLEYCATAYKLIGMGNHESPMWFQYTGTEDLKLMFKSSQTTQIWFALPLKDEDIDLVTYSRYDWIYDYFREVKYNYLRENHPTVYSELK